MRETLHALTLTLGKDESNGPVPNRTIDAQSETKIPLPHQTMSLSMLCLIWWGANGERWDTVRDTARSIKSVSKASRALITKPAKDGKSENLQITPDRPISNIFQIVLDPGLQ